MTQHTPGPWKVIVYPHIGSHHPWIEAESNYNGSGAHLSVSGLMSMEDARLIAAAPDLLGALQYYASSEAWTVNQVEGADGDYGAKARAAIAKATGEA